MKYLHILALTSFFLSSGLLYAEKKLPIEQAEQAKQTEKKTPNKPNILILFVDDLGWSDLGCYGATFHETPKIDKLASHGVRYTDAYSANPVCSPTRAALYTGKAPQRVGITQWIPQPSGIHLPKKEITLAEAFKKAGYQTGFIGKWHLGEKEDQFPNAHGFDWMKAVNRAGQPASYFYPYKNNKGKKTKTQGYWNIPDLENGKEGDFLTNALTDEAIKFIEQKKEQSFLLTLSFYTVHTPIQAPKELVQKYNKKKKQLYKNTKTPFTSDPQNATYRARQDQAVYAAMIENLDSNIGRIIEKLKKEQLLEQTIIVLLSDNGGHQKIAANAPLRLGKGWTHEGGIRVPTIISWQGKIKPAISHTPAITMDIYPTLLELANQKTNPNQHKDGASLLSDLKGNPNKNLIERPLYWTYPHKHGSGHKPSHAMREGNWKLIYFEATKRSVLYNLKNDLAEANDLASKHPEKVKKMQNELLQWVKKTTQN